MLFWTKQSEENVLCTRHGTHVYICVLTLLGYMCTHGKCTQTEVIYGNGGNISLLEFTIGPSIHKQSPPPRNHCPSYCDEEGHKYKGQQCHIPPYCCRSDWQLECCYNASRAIGNDIKDNHNCTNVSEYWQLVLAVCVPLATLSLIAFLGMTSYLMCRRKRARQNGRQRTGSGSDMSCSSCSLSTISPSNTVRSNPLRSPGGTPDTDSRRHRRRGSVSNGTHCDIFVVGSANPFIPPPYIDKPPPYSIACHASGSNRAFDMLETDSLPDYYELVGLDGVSMTDHAVQVEQETQVDNTDACPEYETVPEINNRQGGSRGEMGGYQSNSQGELNSNGASNQMDSTRGTYQSQRDEEDPQVILEERRHPSQDYGFTYHEADVHEGHTNYSMQYLQTPSHSGNLSRENNQSISQSELHWNHHGHPDFDPDVYDEAGPYIQPQDGLSGMSMHRVPSINYETSELDWEDPGRNDNFDSDQEEGNHENRYLELPDREQHMRNTNGLFRNNHQINTPGYHWRYQNRNLYDDVSEDLEDNIPHGYSLNPNDQLNPCRNRIALSNTNHEEMPLEYNNNRIPYPEQYESVDPQFEQDCPSNERNLRYASESHDNDPEAMPNPYLRADAQRIPTIRVSCDKSSNDLPCDNVYTTADNTPGIVTQPFVNIDQPSCSQDNHDFSEVSQQTIDNLDDLAASVDNYVTVPTMDLHDATDSET